MAMQQQIERMNRVRKMTEMLFAKPIPEVDDRVRGLIDSFEGTNATIEQVLSAAMYAAKVTFKTKSWGRCFVQDFAAALNRRGLLTNDQVEVFSEEGYCYLDET